MKNKQYDNPITTYEPKYSSRFTVEFPAIIPIPNTVVKAMTPIKMLPSMKVTTPIVFELYDPVNPSTSFTINDGLRKLRKRDNDEIIIKVKSLGPPGDIVEMWNLTGYIKEIDFGTYNWDLNEPRIIKLTFTVHTAIHEY